MRLRILGRSPAAYFNHALPLIVLLALAPVVHAYSFTKNNQGRADYVSTYDLTGLAFGQQGNAIYDFGKVGKFDTLPDGVTHDIVLDAVKNINDEWGRWANVKWDTTALGDNGTGQVRLYYDGVNANAFTDGFEADNNHYSTIRIGKYATGTTGFSASSFIWTLKHEMGHVLGLKDLYTAYTEEFVDHSAGANNQSPNKQASAFTDNIMNQYRFDGNDYTLDPQTFIDNDEIAGVTWLWGGKFNQIVTGGLASEWNAGNGRDNAKHHGQDAAGTWTYRGSIISAGAAEPYVDIDFKGYKSFVGTAYGTDSPAIEYVGNQGGSLERFKIKKVGFVGNFVLSLTSDLKTERRVNAFIVGGSATDFTLNPMDQALAFAAAGGGMNARFAKVFGPIPEPQSAALLAVAGVLAGLHHRNSRGSNK